MPVIEPERLNALRELQPQILDLRIPLLAAGMSREMLCSGENVTFRIHCYSTGLGEKHGIHAHIEEEHVFIVLQGQALFSGLKGKLPVVEKNQGIWLPKGCFYEFTNPGTVPLVVLRFGAHDKHANASLRLTPEGQPIAGRSRAHPEVANPVVMEGKYFE